MRWMRILLSVLFLCLCFSGCGYRELQERILIQAIGVDQAREYLDMGYFLGIGGVLTFKNAKKLKEVAEYAPMDRLVLETDCPYLTPVPYRGKRNSSLYLSYVAEALAELKGMERDEVIRVTAENARRLYRL